MWISVTKSPGRTGQRSSSAGDGWRVNVLYALRGLVNPPQSTTATGTRSRCSISQIATYLKLEGAPHLTLDPEKGKTLTRGGEWSSPGKVVLPEVWF